MAKREPLMQILFIANPSAPVREFNLSRKKILTAVLLVLLALICLNWFIASITNETRDVMLSMDRANYSEERASLLNASDYSLKLYELQARLQEMQINFSKLNALNEGMKPFINNPNQISLSNKLKADPQGGPLRFNQQPMLDESSYGVSLDLALQESIILNSRVALLQKNFSQNKGTPSSANLGLPLPFDTTASSGLGYRIDPMTSQIAWHDGTDFPAPYGTLILAVASGVVVKAGWSGDYGNMIEVQHSNGNIARYAHAQELMVRVGQNVKKSQPIGKVGSTGRSTGPHLHYEIL